MKSIAKVTLVVALSLGCSSETSSGTTTSSKQCQYKEPGTTFAPCSKDSDCFGSYCDMTGKPSPYCHVPGVNQVAALHGIRCSNDSECASVLPPDAVQRGIVGKCQGRSNLDPAVCQYTCSIPATTPTNPDN